MPERDNDRLRDLRAKMEAHTRIFPLRITPKHHLLGAKCRDCNLRVVRSSGELIGGRCGACHGAYVERRDFPPAA